MRSTAEPGALSGSVAAATSDEQPEVRRGRGAAPDGD